MDRLALSFVPLTKTNRAARHKKVKRCIEALQELRDKPYDDHGNRLVIKFPLKFRTTFKYSAKILNYQIQTEAIDKDWCKLVVRLPEDKGSVFPGTWVGQSRDVPQLHR